jgi:hypothetical protein
MAAGEPEGSLLTSLKTISGGGIAVGLGPKLDQSVHTGM